MATITDSSTVGFRLDLGYDEGLVQGDFVTAPGPGGDVYVAQLVHTESAGDRIEADATVLGAFPDLPFREGAAVERAAREAVLEALALPGEGARLGALRRFDTHVHVPIETVMATQIGVYGRTGSGKSHTARVLAEELLAAGQPVVIVDPHGEYASLKVGRDGTPADHRVLEFARREYNAGADRPIDPDAVDRRELVRPGQATVLNLRGLGAERSLEIAAEYLEDLHLSRMRDRIPPAKVLLEEAHQFAPTRKNDARPVVEDVAKEGRKFGFTLCLITQRPSEVYSNVRAQAQATLAHKLTDDTDIDKLVDSTEGIDTSWRTGIQTLATGEAILAGDLVASPVFVDVRPSRTVHPGRTEQFVVDSYGDAAAVREQQARLEERTATAAYLELAERVDAQQDEIERLQAALEEASRQEGSGRLSESGRDGDGSGADDGTGDRLGGILEGYRRRLG